MTWKAVLEKSAYHDDRLFLLCREFRGKAQFVEPFVFKEREDGESADPTMWDQMERVQDGYPSIRDFMQAIMDEAWAHGMKPKGLEDHINELTAVRYHLEDMRKLAKVKP